MLRPDLVEELIRVRGEYAGRLNHRHERSSHDKGDGQRRIRDVFRGHLDDEERHTSVRVLLSEGVCERHAERAEQCHAAEVDSSSELHRASAKRSCHVECSIATKVCRVQKPPLDHKIGVDSYLN